MDDASASHAPADGIDDGVDRIRRATERAIHEPLRSLEVVLELREDGDASSAGPALDYAEGLCRFYLGETSTAITLSLAASDGFEREGDEAARSQALSLLADACNRNGRLESAAEAGILSLECAQRAGDLSALAWAICALGNTMLHRGAFGRAADLYAASRDAFAAATDRMGEAWMTGNLGEALCRQGEVDRGLAALERCLELVERHAPGTVGVICVMLADAHAGAGRLEPALAHAERGIEWARARGSLDEEGLAMAAAGTILVALGRGGEARAVLTRALEIGSASENVEARLRSLLGLGALHVADGDDGEAVRRLEEAVGLAHVRLNPAEAVTAGRALAGAHARAGRYEEAYRTLEAAVDERRGPDDADDALHDTVEAYLSRAGARAGITLICASCKSVHDTIADHWRPVEGFLTRTLEVQLSHGLCPSCFTEEMRAFT